MLEPDAYTTDSLSAMIKNDCFLLVRMNFDASLAKDFHHKYSNLRDEFKSRNTLLGIALSMHCIEMCISLYKIITHGAIISVAYDGNSDEYTIYYADGLVSSEFLLIAHYFSLYNPDSTYVDIEEPASDKGYRFIVTRNIYIAFNFIANCHDVIPSNLSNLYCICNTNQFYLLSVLKCPNFYRNKYASYTDEYHFTDILIPSHPD